MPPLNLSAANSAISVKAGDLVVSSLTEIGAADLGQNVAPQDSQWGLECLQRRIDLINAQRKLIYAETFPTFPLVLNTQPITIGPGGQFNLPVAPVRIKDWSLILNGTNPAVEIPGMVLTESEWATVGIKNLGSTLATHLYYERQFPLGSLYFWPVPSQANSVRLRIWNALPQALSVLTQLAMPPAYWMYLVCCVASDLAPSFGEAAIALANSAPFLAKYREARNSIIDNTQDVPPLVTDAPLDDRNNSIPDFNFLTGYR